MIKGSYMFNGFYKYTHLYNVFELKLKAVSWILPGDLSVS